MINLYFNGLHCCSQNYTDRQEGFEVPYLGIAHSLFHWTEI